MAAGVPQDGVQVGLHALEQQVEVAAVPRPHHALQPHDVVVLQLRQDADLAVGALRVHLVLEGVEDLLQRVLPPRAALRHPPDVSVGAAPQEGLDFEQLQDVAFDFLAHFKSNYRKAPAGTFPCPARSCGCGRPQWGGKGVGFGI